MRYKIMDIAFAGIVMSLMIGTSAWANQCLMTDSMNYGVVVGGNPNCSDAGLSGCEISEGNGCTIWTENGNIDITITNGGINSSQPLSWTATSYPGGPLVSTVISKGASGGSSCLYPYNSASADGGLGAIKSGNTLHKVKELYFCSDGKLSTPPPNQDPFESCPEEFQTDVDSEDNGFTEAVLFDPNDPSRIALCTKKNHPEEGPGALCRDLCIVKEECATEDDRDANPLLCKPPGGSVCEPSGVWTGDASVVTNPLPYCWEVIQDPDGDGMYEKVEPTSDFIVERKHFHRNPFTSCTGTLGTYRCRPPL